MRYANLCAVGVGDGCCEDERGEDGEAGEGEGEVEELHGGWLMGWFAGRDRMGFDVM